MGRQAFIRMIRCAAALHVGFCLVILYGKLQELRGPGEGGAHEWVVEVFQRPNCAGTRCARWNDCCARACDGRCGAQQAKTGWAPGAFRKGANGRVGGAIEWLSNLQVRWRRRLWSCSVRIIIVSGAGPVHRRVRGFRDEGVLCAAEQRLARARMGQGVLLRCHRAPCVSDGLERSMTAFARSGAGAWASRQFACPF